ncbi:hypothetical protein N7457_005800 [Penicillium paradoxum]|uniref:uncharacterized protein n=1 Tax=Penicillium paradoxum TaxID=176176 RepID=UPI0025468709|nr:uncharacterized protein N7457_005800 [Penicillium paradoxum]KAJ5780640.1 hypothetical protein N7457_005800 [Penicillium paradoxum]
MMLPSLFRYKFGGPDFPEWEARSDECVYFVTVFLEKRHKEYDSEMLMQSMLYRIENGRAVVTDSPGDRLETYCISIPVYGPGEAPHTVILATARLEAETRLNEIQQGFVEINRERLFGLKNEGMCYIMVEELYPENPQS